MEFLKTQIRRIQEQLGGLSTSQRLLVGALVVIMAMTLYWWAAYSASSEMAPLLDQSLSAENVSTITTRMRALGIRYQVSGDRILVASDRRDEAFADIAYSMLLPGDTRSGFDELIARTSPFTPSRMTDAMMVEYRQGLLAGIIRRFPNVSQAAVIINPLRERGPNGIEPSASISITMRSGMTPDARLVNAAANLVSGAVANLKRSNIQVIIDGVSFPVRDRGDYGGSDEYLAQVQKSERYYVDKVAEHLRFIPGAMISVSVKPNIERRETVDHKVDTKNFIQKPVSEQTTTEENTISESGGLEAGVGANVGAAIAEATPSDTTSNNSETSKIDSVVDFGRSDVRISHPGGDLSVTGCSVLVPRSHFTQVYRKITGAGQDPEAAVLDPFITAELQRLRPGVRNCLGLDADEAVHVDVYTDLMPVVAAAPQAASTSLSLSVTSHAREIALGALALISLFLIAGIVRKAAPAPPLPLPAAPKPVTPLAAGEETVGEALDGAGTLDGMEVDDNSVKASQMLGQVSQLVEENPDAAANLVKRWLNRS